jgi:hypothetical protein
MNLIEAYLKYFNQLVILLIGYPCTNKSAYANDLSIDASLNVLNLNNYLIKDKFVEKTIITDSSNNKETKFKIYEHSDNIDWTKFNSDVNNLKSSGVIIHANLMDKDKLDFNIDFSFYFYSPIKYCKDNVSQNNLLNLEKKDINNYFEHVFIPFYSNYDQNIKNIFTIFKFFKITETSNNEDIYNTLFDSLMTNINNNINKKLNIKPINTLSRTNKNKTKNTKNKTKNTKNKTITLKSKKN